jgi:hypothetical protein
MQLDIFSHVSVGEGFPAKKKRKTEKDKRGMLLAYSQLRKIDRRPKK